MRKPSQRSLVLELLEANPTGVCATWLLDRGWPRYAARIAELRKEGHDIVTEPCQVHEPWFHTTKQVQYRITQPDFKETLI